MSSRVSLYWWCWIAIVVAACVLRFVVLDADDDRTPLVVTYMAGTWLPIMALNFFEGLRLISYLETHRSALGGGDPYARSDQRRWLYSTAVPGDPEGMQLRRDIRGLHAFTLTVFFTYPVMVPMLAF